MSWTIEEERNSYQIKTDRRRSDRGFENDPEAQVITLSRPAQVSTRLRNELPT